MIYSKDYIFIHIPHSAGTFIEYYLSEATLHKIHPKHHIRLKDLKKYLKRKYLKAFKFGTIRNPYSWYISHYYYTMRVEDSPDYQNVLKTHGVFNFDTFMKNKESHFNEFGCGRYTSRFLGYFYYDEMDGYEFNKQFIKPDIEYLCRIENLKEELKYMFNHFIYRLNYFQTELLNQYRVQNKSPYKDWHDLYLNNNWADKVYQWDKSIIKNYNYSF